MIGAVRGMGTSAKRVLMRFNEFVDSVSGVARDISPRSLSLKNDEEWPKELPSLLIGEQSICSSPKLIFTFKAFQQLDFYYRSIGQEFQLMGLVEHDAASNQFVVTELVLNSHSAGMAHAELDEGTLPGLLDQLEKEGKDIRKLRLQCHSHGNIPAYFSSTDLKTIEEEYVCDWMISMVGNTSRDYKARLDVFSPITVSIALPIYVQIPELPQNVQRHYLELLRQSMGLEQEETTELEGK